jgi:hypothetical protein
VIETQSLTQAPVEMVSASALAAASLAAQGHADVARDALLVGPIGIFTITVGLSGERKSAIDNKLWLGCRNAADSIHQLREQEITLAAARIKIWEGTRDALQKELTRLILLSRKSPGPTKVSACCDAGAVW